MRYYNDILKFSKSGFVFIGSAIDTVIFEVIPMIGTVFAMIMKQSREREVIYPKYEERHYVGFLSYAVRILKERPNTSRENPHETPPLRGPSQLQGKKEVTILIVDDESDITVT
jgi:hypothetical protein